MKASLELVCTSSTAAMIVHITSLTVCFLFIDLFLLIFFSHLGLTGKYLVVFNLFYCFLGSLSMISFLKLTYSRH